MRELLVSLLMVLMSMSLVECGNTYNGTLVSYPAFSNCVSLKSLNSSLLPSQAKVISFTNTYTFLHTEKGSPGTGDSVIEYSIRVLNKTHLQYAYPKSGRNITGITTQGACVDVPYSTAPSSIWHGAFLAFWSPIALTK
jgi:hypothetical protein